MLWNRVPARSVVPIALAIAMLGVVTLSVLAPITGAVPADTNCPYGVCPSVQNNLLPWEIALGILILVAVLLALLIALRRRRRGGGGAPGPVEPWTPAGPPAGAGVEAPMAPPVAPAVVAAPPVYLETPEDVGAPPPSVPAAAPPPAAPAAAGGAEADIDSLMQELDKISNEILKRGGPKTGKDAATDSNTSDTEGSGGSS
ncbi:MAG TPA: hypothetical protein VEY07_03945 [Thermoplasmata archaeon]|nr:hypothetical protein [Thermoplasmata archaeon]